MVTLFQELSDILAGGNNAMLVMVVANKGSSPGSPGAMMLVDANGRRAGTIGGGALEYQAEQAAISALASARGDTRSFSLSHGSAGDIGMVCGGDVTVHFYYLPAHQATAQFAAKLAEVYSRDENAWLVVDTGENGGIALVNATDGFYPLEFSDKGQPYPSLPVKQEQLPQLMAPLAVLADIEGHSIYSQPLVRAGRCVIFGGGHVAQALAPVLSSIDFNVVLFEDRQEFANPALFPTASRVVLGDYANIEASLPLTSNDWLVVVTRGHLADYEVLKQVLKRPFTYVGVIGSRTKIASVNAKLLKDGIPQQTLDQVHTPIGIGIGAVTPAEIAVSIAAELIQVRAGLQAQSIIQ